MACCTARRVSGRAWDGDVKPAGFLRELVLLAGGTLLGALGIAMILLLWPFSIRARRQRRRFVAAVTDSLERRAGRVLDAPFLVGPSGRCRASSSLYPVSRRLSGVVFRYFNLLLFAGILASLAALGAAGLAFAG